MKNNILALMFAGLVMTGCTAKTDVKDMIPNSESTNTQEVVVTETEKTGVAPESEDLGDVVENLDEELESMDVEATYEDVSAEDLGY